MSHFPSKFHLVSQQPFVNLVKLTTDKSKNVRVGTTGKTKHEIDKFIGKKVYRMSGKIPSNNTLRIPRLVTRSLNLTGQFGYLQLVVDPDKLYVFSITVVTKDDHTIKLLVSNMYKAVKVQQTRVHLPGNEILANHRWTVVAFDFATLVKKYYSKIFHYVKCVHFSSNLVFRNLYTSDIIYTSTKLPRDMYLPVRKKTKWSDIYDWIWFPKQPRVRKFKSPSSYEELKVTIKNEKVDVNDKTLFEGLDDDDALGDNVVVGSTEEIKIDDDHDGEEEGEKVGSGDVESENLDDNEISSTESSPKNIAKVVKMKKNKKRKSRRKISPLSPDPICKIKQVLGYSSSKIRWVGNDEIIFSHYDKLVRLNVKTREQVTYLSGTGNTITTFSVNATKNILVSGEEISSDNDAEKSVIPLTRVWNLATGECVCVFYAGFDTCIKTLDVSFNGDMVVAVGNEKNSNRGLVVIYDISKVFEEKDKARLVTKGHSIHHIACVRFEPFSETSFVTCGLNNIRFWRVKSAKLRSSSINPENFVTSPALLNNNFTDLSFEYSFHNRLEKEYHLFVSSKMGNVYSIDYRQRLIESVYQVHDSEINSIFVNEGMCVTGSSDKFVRVWPLDFRDYFIEIEHDSSVSSVSISDDGILLVIGTTNGSIGMTNLTNQHFETLLRSHTKEIISIDMDPSRNEFATVSMDKSTRIWNVHSYEQLYQFDTIGETPLIVTYHPAKYQIAVGYDSGIIRIFDISSTTVINEYKPHNTPIMDLAYTKDTKWLLSVSDTNLTISDVNHSYEQVKMLFFKFKCSNARICLSNDGKYFASLGPEKNIINVFNLENFGQTHTFAVQTSESFSNFAFSKFDKHIIAITSDCRMLKMSLDDGKIIMEKPRIHKAKVNSISLDQSGKYLATASDDKLLKIWDVDKFKCQTFFGHSGAINQVRFLRNTNYLCTAGADSVIVWDFFAGNGGVKRDVGDLVKSLIIEGKGQLDAKPKTMTEDEMKKELDELKPDFDGILMDIVNKEEENTGIIEKQK